MLSLAFRMMKIPTAYLPGYEKARLVDSELADNYVAHTTIGDPVMDGLLRELQGLRQGLVHRYIRAGMEEDHVILREAPQVVRDFFVDAPQPEPEWLDHGAFDPGIRAFHRNSGLVLAAFVAGALIEGFSTLISKSFVQTGRIFDNGVWRLKQNNRHQLEIFWPGGLQRQGEGWKLSVRIRFVHGQVRLLLGQTEEWDWDAWGVPISAAHVGYATAAFASRSVKHSTTLGAHYSEDERASFHAAWRYAGYLMGVPESILYTDETHANQIFDIGNLCEPDPTEDAILMTNALINSAPLVAGIEEPESRKKLVQRVIYPVSRALIGKELADVLRFPNRGMPFPIFAFRLDQFIKRTTAKLTKQPMTGFTGLLETSAYDDSGVSYRLPDHAHAERSGWW